MKPGAGISGFGKVLRVDLTSGKIAIEDVPMEVRRKYVGGSAVNDWLFWQHFLKVDPKIHPLSPENVMIAGPGVLTGTGFPLGAKIRWTFKSPVTGIFGDSSSGGRFASSLKWAGYDHVVVTGKAAKPVYIWINNEEVEIRSAELLWGQTPLECGRRIRKELRDQDIETAWIGQAGENQAHIASIRVSRNRMAARCGGGAVMGSKNLKGLVVRGTKGIRIHDPQALFKTFDETFEIIRRTARTKIFQAQGVTSVWEPYNILGVNSFHNGQRNVVPPGPYELIHPAVYQNKLGRNPLSCCDCAVGCSSAYEVKGDETLYAHRYRGEIGTRAEYGGQASFGSLCDIPDWAAVNHLWKMCNDYNMDAFEAGCCCGLLMELWERGVIHSADLREWMGAPLSLDWGNLDAVEEIIKAIGLQNTALGKMAGKGVYQLGKEIERIKGVPALKYALYGKGGAAHPEDIRNTPAWAINYAVSTRGCDHLKGLGTLDKIPDPKLSMKYFGTPDAAGLNTLLKGASSAICENVNGMYNLLGTCTFVCDRDQLAYSPEFFSRVVFAVTGLEFSPDELYLAGERSVNLEKAFNSRIGLRREDDRLCERWMREPQADGMRMKAEDYFEDLKSEQYAWHGWDTKSSLQKRTKLAQLDLQAVAEVLAREGALCPE